jgi:glycosyltransferase involved in cell wall biosynthesis
MGNSLEAPWLIVGDGASIHIQRLAAAVSESGIGVHLAAFEGQDIDGVETHSLGSWHVREDRRYLLAIPRLIRLIRRLRPAIVHAHYISSYGLMAGIATRVATRRARVVQTAWGSDLLVTARGSSVRRALASFVLGHADLITGDSADLLFEAARLAPRVARHRFVFGPPAALLRAPRAEEPTVLSARGLVPEMRVDRIIHAFATMPHDWRLVVAGEGRERAHLEDLAHANRRVSFTGQITQADLHALMLRARIAVSVPISDGSSAALLEALAAGMAPLVTDLPANREWVTDEVGAVVPKDPTIAEIADALRRLQVRPPAPQKARALVEASTWEHQVAGLIQRIGEL